MSADPGAAALTALRRFVERVSPYDPDPLAGPAVTLGLVGENAGGTVVLTPHLARALSEALERYQDPADRGSCAACGGRRLDEHLHCLDCGRLHGVYGELLAERAERARREGASAPTSPPAGAGRAESGRRGGENYSMPAGAPVG